MDIYVGKKQDKQKKKGTNWGLLLIAAIGGGCYIWEKRKKAQAQAAAQKAYQDRLLPPVKETIVHVETGSPESRLKALGINTSAPGQYQASGENYKEI